MSFPLSIVAYWGLNFLIRIRIKIVIYQFPGTEDKSDKKGKVPGEIHFMASEYSETKQERGFKDFNFINPVQGIWGRLLFFLGTGFAGLWGVVSLMLLLVALPFGALTCFKWYPLQEVIRKYWIILVYNRMMSYSIDF